jgi:hypothetical protein
MQREIPGRDASDDADRLFRDYRIADLLFEFEFTQQLRVDPITAAGIPA